MDDGDDWLYRARTLHHHPEREAPRIIFIGDSITDNWRFHAPAIWEEYYGSRRALNLGIWADKTQQVLWRLTEYPLERFDPEVVVIQIGINNIFKFSSQDTVSGILAVVDLVQEQLPNSRILLLGLFPIHPDPRDRPRRIEDVNERLTEWARQAESEVVFLDIGHAFLTEDGFIPQEYLIDPIHLSETGYRVWAEAMEPTLSRLLDPSKTDLLGSGGGDMKPLPTEAHR